MNYPIPILTLTLACSIGYSQTKASKSSNPPPAPQAPEAPPAVVQVDYPGKFTPEEIKEFDEFCNNIYANLKSILIEKFPSIKHKSDKGSISFSTDTIEYCVLERASGKTTHQAPRYVTKLRPLTGGIIINVSVIHKGLPNPLGSHQIFSDPYVDAYFEDFNTYNKHTRVELWYSVETKSGFPYLKDIERAIIAAFNSTKESTAPNQSFNPDATSASHFPHQAY